MSTLDPSPGRVMELALRDEERRALLLVDPRGGPVVVALASRWDAAAARRHGDALRAELRGFGATLLVFDGPTLWRIRPDDPIDRVTVEEAGAALPSRDAAALLGLAGAGEPPPDLSVLLIDPRGHIRFRQVEATTGGDAVTTLVGALRSAARARRGEAPQRLIQLSRRELVLTTLVTALALWIGGGCAEAPPPPPVAPPAPPPAPPTGTVSVTLKINGQDRTLDIEPRVTLLDALREKLGLTGSKKGCDQGQCGACTVHVEGRRVLSCLTLAIMHQGASITTIEGLAKGSELHPMQAAFLEHDGLQCGFCTPGQIMSAVALLHEGHAVRDDQVREEMSGNLCRCGAYPNIVAAIQSARGRS
jgi:xanthine dehydrogenase YagT iron-sulfur-binding subunit